MTNEYDTTVMTATLPGALDSGLGSVRKSTKAAVSPVILFTARFAMLSYTDSFVWGRVGTSVENSVQDEIEGKL